MFINFVVSIKIKKCSVRVRLLDITLEECENNVNMIIFHTDEKKEGSVQKSSYKQY